MKGNSRLELLSLFSVSVRVQEDDVYLHHNQQFGHSPFLMTITLKKLDVLDIF